MSAYTCTLCPRSFSTDRARFLHQMNDHTPEERGVKVHRTVRKRRFSHVAKDGGCPGCGGQSLKAKRSMLGKSVGAMFGGLGILLAPKSQVRCESCGQTFKRG